MNQREIDFSTRRQHQLKRQRWVKFIAFIGVVAFVVLILLTVENMLLSALLAFVLSYLLGPAVNSMERAGVNRLVATSIAFAGVGVLLVGAVVAITPFISEQLNTLRMELPKYISGVTEFIQETEEKYQGVSSSLYPVDLSSRAEDFLISWTGSIFESIPTVVTKSFTVLILAPFLAFFMIQDGRALSKALMSLAPNNLFEVILNLYHQINVQMGQFIRARLLEAGIIGFVTWLGLWIIDFPFAFFLGIFAALTNLIPYIGPIIGAVPAVLIALINGESAFGLSLVVLVYLIAQTIDALFIIPVVVAKIVDLHPITVMVAIIVGAQLMGILGMLISIPIASVLKVTLGTVFHHLTAFRA